ncbi:Smr/MutS family protein [Sphingosinicella sp. CPCC 101087]|uniref:Smr/MutS family protein n=1 Tax=Sphingosinicella sp. CPCC 101087 TaxID=2497754 RepID=UPI00101BE78A|nr:Smr/MutS family protein [Sphingosinicella sp. CPCC 101087]
MARRLSAEERALWRKVVETVRPFEGMAVPAPETAASNPGHSAAAAAPPQRRRVPPAERAGAGRATPGTTLDGGWDRRLARGLVAPDAVVDLHGHDLAGAYARLDRNLEEGIARGWRLLLLVTGKPPRDDRRPVVRGAIRAAVGDWLQASRHAADIAAVRNAHPRHGGTGALYIVLRRKRDGRPGRNPP